MSITVKINKRSAGGRATLYTTREFDTLPVTIGRDATCSIVLEDPDKHISRVHVEIQEEDGVHWMAVVSKVNPVMVNGHRHGPGAHLPLYSGDTFEIAEYEVQLLLPEPVVMEEAPANDPVIAVLGATATQARSLDAANTAERLFNESTFLGGDAAPPKLAPVLPDRTAPEETFVPQRPAPASTPAGPLRAFLEGAGAPPRDVPPAEAERMLREYGAMLRSAVDGIMTLLATRGEVRKAFGASERSRAAGNESNPLHRLADTQQAMEFLFDPGERTGGLLDPAQALRGACEELRAHELALAAAMRMAIRDALGRLDPALIEQEYDKGRKGFSLASRNGKLWELYVAQQEKLSSQSQNDFNSVFGREFMAAYQAALTKGKDAG